MPFRIHKTIFTTAKVALLASLLPTISAFATDYTWTGAGTGNTWTDATNWTPSGIPGTSTTGQITFSSALTASTTVAIDFNSFTSNTLTIGSLVDSAISSNSPVLTLAPATGESGTLLFSTSWSATGSSDLVLGQAGSTAMTLNWQPNVTSPSFNASAGRTITINASLSSGSTANSMNFTGAGTTILNSASTYAMPTNVEAGTLLVNNTTGSATGSDSVLVNQGGGGTLSGNGIISGQVNIFGSGSIAPGNNGIGTLSTGPLSFRDGSTYKLELNTTTNLSDKVNVTGGLGFVGNPVLSLTDLGGNKTLTPGDVFAIIDYSGTWNGGTFAGLPNDSTFVFGANTYEINYNGVDGQTSAVTLQVVPPVPEHSVLSLFGLVGAGFLLRRRR